MEQIFSKMIEDNLITKEQAVEVILELQTRAISMGSFLRDQNILPTENLYDILILQMTKHISFKEAAVKLNLWDETFESELIKSQIQDGHAISSLLVEKKYLKIEELVKIFDHQLENFENNSAKNVTIQAEDSDAVTNTATVAEYIEETSEVPSNTIELNLPEQEVVTIAEAHQPMFKDEYNEHFQEDLIFKIESLKSWSSLDELSKKVLFEVILEKLNQIKKISQSYHKFSIEEFAFLIASSFTIFVENLDKINDSKVELIANKLLDSSQMLWKLRGAAASGDNAESAPELDEEYLFFIQDFSTFCDEFLKE